MSVSLTPAQAQAARVQNTRVVRAHLAWFDGVGRVTLLNPGLRYNNLAETLQAYAAVAVGGIGYSIYRKAVR